MRIESLRIAHQAVGPLRGQQVGLFEEIEELVGRPFRVGKALVARVGRGDRWRPLAGHAPRRVSPELQIGAAEIGLQIERAGGVGEPVFGDLAERADHLVDLPGLAVVGAAVGARLEIGGHRLAALFDHAAKIFGELLDIDEAALARFGGGSHVFSASIRRA